MGGRNLYKDLFDIYSLFSDGLLAEVERRTVQVTAQER